MTDRTRIHEDFDEEHPWEEKTLDNNAKKEKIKELFQLVESTDNKDMERVKQIISDYPSLVN